MTPVRRKQDPANRVKVSVPATTANLGPGYDTLGLALDLSNEFTVTRLGREDDRTIGRGTCEKLHGGANVFHEAMDRIYRMARRKRPKVQVEIDGKVPIGRGLGSSATAVVGGALTANAMLGSPFNAEELIGPVAEIEGHPDNVAPALFGSLTAAVTTPQGVIVHVYRPHTTWHLAVLIPSFELPTGEARKAIPKRVPHADAVFNLTRIPFVIDAITEGDSDVLHRIMEDRLHEPYRKKFIKGYDRIRVAGLRAGAPAVYLSGAGPTLAAFCAGKSIAERVRKAMSRAASFDPNHKSMVLKPNLKGARVRVLG